MENDKVIVIYKPKDSIVDGFAILENDEKVNVLLSSIGDVIENVRVYKLGEQII